MNAALAYPMSVVEAIYGRRSVRSFATSPVSVDQVNALLAAAVQAPTAMHSEPWLFVVIQSRLALRRYSDLAKATLIKQAELYRDLHDPSLTPKNGGFLKALGSPEFNVFYDAGTAVLICTRPANPFVAADCWLAAGNLMLAATAMGLGTCCVGSALPGVNLPEVKRDLAIPEDVEAVAAIAIGVPAQPLPAGTRNPPTVLAWRRDAGGE